MRYCERDTLFTSRRYGSLCQVRSLSPGSVRIVRLAKRMCPNSSHCRRNGAKPAHRVRTRQGEDTSQHLWGPARNEPYNGAASGTLSEARRAGLTDSPLTLHLRHKPDQSLRNIGACQMFSQYSRIERSEENFPIRATFSTDIFVHFFLSWKAALTLSWLSTYAW